MLHMEQVIFYILYMYFAAVERSLFVHCCKCKYMSFSETAYIAIDFRFVCILFSDHPYMHHGFLLLLLLSRCCVCLYWMVTCWMFIPVPQNGELSFGLNQSRTRYFTNTSLHEKFHHLFSLIELVSMLSHEFTVDESKRMNEKEW